MRDSRNTKQGGKVCHINQTKLNCAVQQRGIR